LPPFIRIALIKQVDDKAPTFLDQSLLDGFTGGLIGRSIFLGEVDLLQLGINLLRTANSSMAAAPLLDSNRV
jgi:hypothetical protein